MIVEVVAVGTELLLGQIVNTNASTIGRALADHGFDAHYQQVVGDNMGRLVDALNIAMRRSDAVVVTGGIGPTRDDMTREALAEATGRPLEFSDEYAERLRRAWEMRGRVMPESNLRQAEYPRGAEQVINPKGSAPGLILEHEDTVIFCIPGVPEEMEYLLNEIVLPRLLDRSGGPAVVISRLVKTWGQSESMVGEILDDLYQGSTNPSVAFLASGGEIKVRVTAKAADRETALSMIEPVEAEVRRRLDGLVFGTDDDTVHSVLRRHLSERGWTIATAESMTGGMVSAALTSVPGASTYVRGGLVAYDSELKARLLGVSDTSSVVDEETAIEMARGGQKLLEADVVVAVTGSAGPEPMERPIGTIIIAVATPDDARAREMRMPGDRERVRTYGTTSALHLARLAVSGSWWQST